MKYFIFLLLLTIVAFGDAVLPTSLNKIENTVLITRLAAMEKKNLLIIGDSKGMIRFLTLDTLQEIKSFKAHETEITQIIFPEDEQVFFTTAKDKTIKQWDTQMCNLLHVYAAHESIVSHIDITPDGSKLVSMDSNLTAYYWEISMSNIMTKKIDLYEIDRHCKRNGEKVEECYSPPIATLPELEYLHDIKISKDGKYLITTYSSLIIFDLNAMKKIESFYRYDGQSFGNLYRAKTANRIYAAVNKKGIVLIDPNQLEFSILRFGIESSISLDKNETKIIGVDYANANQKRIRRFDINQFKQLADIYRSEKDMVSNVLLVDNQIILADRDVIEFISFESGKIMKYQRVNL